MRFERRNHAGGHTYYLDGEKLDGVTTVIGAALRKKALEEWSGNATAEAAVNRWDELGQLRPTERLAVLKKARYEARDAAALRGTEIHDLAWKLVTGEDVDVPEAHQGPVQALARCMDLWQMRPVLRERPVFHVEHGWAGTFDLLCGIGEDLWLIDFKTGKGVYEDVQLQLAAYAHATHAYTTEPIDWTPPDKCGAIHITADSAELHEVDASDDAYLTFRYAQQIARWAGDVQQAWRDKRPWPVGPALQAPS